MRLARLRLYVIVLLEEIPTLISVTRWRVCEFDDGHEWSEWGHVSGVLPSGLVVRRCELCDAREHAPAHGVVTQQFGVSPNLN